MKPRNRILTKVELDLLFDAAEAGSRHGDRDATLLLLMYHYGIRPSELAELRWSWIDLGNGIMKLKRVRSEIITQHHLEREDIVRLKRLKESHDQSRTTAEDFVFKTERGARFTTRGIHLIVAKAAREAGFDLAVNPSMLRRCCGFEAAVTGNEKQVQAALGHKRVRNSVLYMRKLTDTAFLSDEIPSVRHAGHQTIFEGRELEACITLQIPASTANLGPGLDVIGLAVSAYTRLTFAMLNSDDQSIPLITFSGGILSGSQAADLGDLVYTILKKLWSKNKNQLKRLRVLIRSDIPLGCGLGSSGAAILGALWASQVLNGKIPTRSSLLARAQDIEGHPETLAASLVGQLVVAAPDRNKVLIEQIQWPVGWHLIFVVPPYTLTTTKARAVLPKSVSLNDAIFNMQRTALLLAAVARGNEAMMSEALVDRLHERYRARLVPELESIRKFLESEPIIGCVLSGAGSSVLVIVHKRHKVSVEARLLKWTAARRDGYRVLPLEVDRDGMQELKLH